MATSSFRSTTRRTSLGNSSSSSSSTHRRSRSVTRFDEASSVNRSGKFVNTVRGSGVPDISLDDLAIELFSSTDFGRVCSSVNERDSTRRRRGRSVSRNSSGGNSNNGNCVSDGASRRRRSLSVASRRMTDSENEHLQRNQKHSSQRDLSVVRKERPSWQKPTASSQQKGLRRSSSQKDMLRSHDGYSSYSSTLTDDEGNDAHNIVNGVRKEFQAPYSQPKAMAENFDSVQSAQDDVLKSISNMTSYRTQLEQSAKRKQELLAEIMFVEERGKELKKIVGELHPNSKETAATRRPTRGRKRSKDRNRMPKQLFEDADKIIEDFISSFEETDISSFDGERSDTSSIIGGAMKPIMQYGDFESFKTPLRSGLFPAEMDGVVLPWLKWETSNDITPLLRSDSNQCHASPESGGQDSKEEIAATPDEEQSVNTKSSRGSWSLGVANSFTLDMEDISKTGDANSCKSHLLSQVPRRSRIDIDDYLKPPSDESFLFERWKHRERMSSSGLLICQNGSLGKFFI